MLKLDKLLIKNFSNISAAAIDFNSQVILFHGDNGSGKSSVLEAIAVCLAEHKRSEAYKDYVKNGESEAYLELQAFIKDEPISFKITIKNGARGSMERLAKYQGKEWKNSEVTQLLEQLGLLYYSNILFSMQGEGDITKLTPVQRANYLKQLLSFDFSDILKEIEDRSKTALDAAAQENNIVKFKTGEIETRKTEIKDLIPMPCTEEEYANAAVELASLEKELCEYSGKIAQNAAIDKQISDTKLEISNLNNEALKFENKKRLMEQAEQDKADNMRKLTDVEKEIEDLAKISDALSIEIEAITQDVNSLFSEKDSITPKLASVIAERQVVTRSLEAAMKGKCPVCNTEFTGSQKDEYQAEFDKLSEEIESLKETQNSLTEKYAQRREELLLKEKEFHNAQTALAARDREVNLYKAELNKEIEHIDIPDYSETIISLNKQILRLEESKIAIGEAPDDSKISIIRNKIERFNNTKAQNELIKKHNIEVEETITRLQSEIMEAQTRITELNDKIELYKNAKTIFDKSLPNYLVVKACASVQGAMNEFIQGIFPNMTVQLFHSKKGVEFFYTNYGDTDLTKENMMNIKMASGFEKSVLSMAFKEALCRAYGLPFCVLDEVDSAASDSNSEKMFDSIICGGFFEQCIIITHKPVIRDVITQFASSVHSYHVDKGNFALL